MDITELLDDIGESICDNEIAKMVKAGVIRDATPETGDTETGIALIVLTYLQQKLLARILTAVANTRKDKTTSCPVCGGTLIVTSVRELKG